MNTYVIGCGGTGSILVPILCKLISNHNVVLMDGDTLEHKNLDRQLFSPEDLGRNKAEALAMMHGCEFLPEWFAFGGRPYEEGDWLICCADNHPCRAAVLQACDYHKCRAIIAGNETNSSDAYVYLPEWRDTNLDPRVMFPEILTVTTGDPRRAAIGCTGEAQESNRQLVTANMMAAALAMHLFVCYQIQYRKLSGEARQHLPHMLRQNLSKSESFKATQTNQRTDRHE